MKKVTIVLVSLAVLAIFTAPLSAQQFTILEMETGTIFGYNLSTDNIYNDTRLGVNFNFSNAVIAGFLFQNNARYMTLRYSVTDKIAAGVLIGSTGATPSAGVQMSYALLTNKVQSLSTSLKLGLEYIVPNVSAVNAVENGLLGVTLSLGFGI